MDKFTLFNPYPKYKDSGVPWLGEVPHDWETRNFRTILVPIAVRNRPDLPLLSVVREKGVIKRNLEDAKENHNCISEDLSNHKVVKAGQFAMNKMKAWQGSYGISKNDGIVSPAYFVFNLNNVGPDFFHKAVRSKAYVPFFTQASDGVRVGQWDLSQTRMKEIPFFIPSLPEQTQIARFLDWKTVQIAKFIKAKKRMIELLKEQKQVIINDAVTGKIDVSTGKPYPKYKDSGVEWLGQVPDEWEVRKLKHTIIGKLQYGANSSGVEYSDNLPRYIRITDFNKDGTLDEQKKLSLTKVSAMGYYLKEGDILFARSGATVGKAFQCKNLKQTSCFAGYLIKAEPNPSIILSDFVYLYAQSFIFIKWKNYNFIKATIENIGADKYSQLLIPIPIKKIQSQIITFIETKTAAIDLTISRTEREIALMQEYRDRLIADVVTGKIDVRNIPVPEEIEEILLDEEIEAEDLEEMEEVEE